MARSVADERIIDVRCTDASVTFVLLDGRTISAPTAWYPQLHSAKPEQRAIWEISAAGYGVHWPKIDADLSSEGILTGARAPMPAARI